MEEIVLQPDVQATTIVEEGSFEPEEIQVSFKWTEECVNLLLSLIKEKKPLLTRKKRKKAMWESISKSLAEEGYDIPWEIISKKWSQLITTYKMIIDRHNSKGCEDSTWPYYSAFCELLSRPNTQQQARKVSSSNGSSLQKPGSVVRETNGSLNLSDESNVSSSVTLQPQEGLTLKRTALCQPAELSESKILKLQEESLVTSSSSFGAPAWFLRYCERREQNARKWREGFAVMMADRTRAIEQLSCAISHLIESQK